eukprot:TRINITY_DN105471_c1_g1_i1.p1 TRINITY_DN105471_c1_g1~~TRINITY_DN105471_c1_g1_i1.p1  ORF type:complete len:519 (-),score=71.19 TRINITY_DN105471_c1_g1_i1:91-1647(-)
MENEQQRPPAEEAKDERKYCNFEHIQNITAYCNVCASYVCESCQIESHFNHDMIHLEAECFKKFSEYKKVVYDTQVTLKQYEKAADMQSVDEILSAINSKVEKKFNELIERILAYKDKMMNELIESQEIQEAINERKYRLEENLATLKGIQTDAQNLIEKIQADFTNRRYIILFERDANAEIKPLQKRLQDWKSQAASNPLKIQQLGADLCVKVTESEKKLKSLIKVMHYSHPPPQPLYDFNNENNKLMLFDMHKKSPRVICLQRDCYIPYHYSSTHLGSKIYFVGGDDDGYRKDCYAASIKKRTITQLANLNVERRDHTLVPFHISKLIYCMGGYNKFTGVLNSVEKYQISQNRWTSIPSLLEKRQWPGGCQFNDRFLYCFGGSRLDTIERLDTSNEEKGWESVVTTKKCEAWVGMSACGAIQISPGEILIFGGCVKKDTDEVFAFDPETRTFSVKAKMPMPSLFCQAGAMIADNYIGAIGWRNDHIYIYDTVKDAWTLIEADKYQMEEFVECQRKR